MSQGYKPGDVVYVEFCTQVFSSGVATNADSLPTGTVNRNGTDDGAVTVTVANIDTGRYKASFTIPATYVPGDVLNLTIAATVSSVAGKAAVWHAKLDYGIARASTAQAGGNTSITLDASASATTDFYKGALIFLVSGTGAGQVRVCTAYNGSTKVATITPAWATNPDVTSVFAVLPAGPADVEAWVGAAPNALVSGRVDASIGANNAGNLTADLQTIKGQTVTCSAGVTVGAFVGNATHALTVDASGNVTVATNNDKTGYSLTQAFPSNFASLAITVGGAVTVGTNNDKTGYSLTQSFPANFAALGISVGGHISNVDTLTTYTGDTPQTGDAYNVVKSGGAGDAAAIKAKTDSLTFSVAGKVDANIRYVNSILVNGAGTSVSPWGP